MPVLDVLDQPADGVGAAHGLLNVHRVPQQQVRGLPEQHPVNSRQLRRQAEVDCDLADEVVALILALASCRRTAHRFPLHPALPPLSAGASAAGLFGSRLARADRVGGPDLILVAMWPNQRQLGGTLQKQPLGSAGADAQRDQFGNPAIHDVFEPRPLRCGCQAALEIAAAAKRQAFQWHVPPSARQSSGAQGRSDARQDSRKQVEMEVSGGLLRSCSLP
jgi:hypothetical protein